MRELEEIFRKELPSRHPKPGTPRHEAFEAAIAKFDRVALGAASPAIAEAARSLSESAHALMDTPFDKRPGKSALKHLRPASPTGRQFG